MIKDLKLENLVKIKLKLEFNAESTIIQENKN